MIVVVSARASAAQIEALLQEIRDKGFTPHKLVGEVKTVIACIGDNKAKEALKAHLVALPEVESVLAITKEYKLAARTDTNQRTVLDIRGVKVGGPEIVVVGGPCSVESQAQITTIGTFVKKAGGKMLRGGAYKPRTSPYNFQGQGEDGLKQLAAARDVTGLPIVSEIMDHAKLDLMEKYVDVLQVGARNTQNFELLKALGRSTKTVLLKRGMATTLDELLNCAEYVLAGGNPNVILCERGIRTFEKATRNTLDLNAVPYLKDHSHLPVAVDPSHGIGIRKYVTQMALAGVAAGADMLLIEAHTNPEIAWSDGQQTLNEAEFADMIARARVVAQAVGRTL